MEGGHFKTTGDNGYARATEVMNSKCSNNFRWSILLRTKKIPIWIGIASKLQHTDDTINSYDKNAILCLPTVGSIFHRETIAGTNLKLKSGDAIHFIFQSKLKKFSIILVCYLYFGIDFTANFRKIKNMLSTSKKMSTIFQLFKEIGSIAQQAYLSP